jgi:hypothetical protein
MEEGSGNSIQATTTQSKWKGINLHGDEKPATHQQFVDETMLMATPMIKEDL